MTRRQPAAHRAVTGPPPLVPLALLLAAAMAAGCAATHGGSHAPPAAPAFDAAARAALAAQVRGELLHAWQGYERGAWGHDELRPISHTVRDWYGEPLLMTPVDSLDTLLLAGLPDEAAKAKELIVERLSFDRDASVQVFEVTIRL